MSNNFSHINSIAALQHEQQRVRSRIKQQEVELKRKMQELPGELAVVGANSFIPKILRGKVTNTALKGGKFLVNKLFVDSEPTKKGWSSSGKASGAFSIAKTLFKILKPGKK